MKQSNKKAYIVVAVMIFMIIFTRAITISHNMELHPDEHVFYNAAQSLKNCIFDSTQVFEEEKEYPEGAFVLQLPFHILSSIIYRLSGISVSPQLSGRIAAVFYFTAGAVIGCAILYKYLSQKLTSLIIYGCTIVFSVIHITQSRYGTSDAITLSLLMAVIYLAARSLDSKKHNLAYIISAFFMTGALAAAKYPLIFFAVIPVFCAVKQLKKYSFGKRVLLSLVMLTALYIGFAILSPKAAFDPMYIVRASTREVGAYVTAYSYSLADVWTHFMAMLTYSFFYSGFPLMPIFFGLCIKHLLRNTDSFASSSEATLFSIVIPALTVIFFVYNLFVMLLVSRTYYPFFFLTDLYVSAYIGNVFSEVNTRKRIASCALCLLMVGRGIYYLALLSEKNDSEKFADMIADVVDENWEHTTILSGFMVLPQGYNDYPDLQLVNSDNPRFLTPESTELKHGELFIAGARLHTVYSLYYNFLPSQHSSTLDSEIWLKFLEQNSEYYVGRPYPLYTDYILGNWIMGTNGCYEFPTACLFYRP